MDAVVFALPVLVALAPVIVALSRDRKWIGPAGFGMFTWGWVSLVFFVGAENSGNNPIHLLWLLGLTLIELGMVPHAQPDSWWHRRYGQDREQPDTKGGGTSVEEAPAREWRFIGPPVSLASALALFIVVPYAMILIPLVTILLVIMVIGAALTVILTRNRTAEGMALMGAASLAPVVAVGFAYISDAFFFGF